MNRGLKIAVQLMFALLMLALIQLLFHPFNLTLTAPDSALLPASTMQNPATDSYSAAEATPSEAAEKSAKEINAELRKEIIRNRKAADALEARKHAAFIKWWQAPKWCMDENGMKALVQCSDLKRAKRAEFEELLAAGKLTLPSAVQSEAVAP